MLRVVEEAYRSDVGRQRRANEDSYFASPPLFAVADGMGGAQAGEVASRIAAESFDPDARRDASPERYLRTIAEEANARIHRLAQADATRSGMGTTLTAALLEGEELSLAHVGDSRAYRFRDGELKLLTADHSLVEELRRQGRLTDEQAEDHPQRSIITRALGPEPQVDVDTMTYRARPGDVYLLCSDGLTTMVKEERIATVLGAGPGLQAAVDRLIADANEAGGRDNITVVAFRLEEAGAPAAAVDGKTLVGPSAEEAELSGADVRARAREAERRRAAALGGAAAERRPIERPRRRRRGVIAGLVVVAVAAIVAAAAIWGARQIYFLGGDGAGRLALYRGLPYELPFGIKLYSETYAAPVQVGDLPRNAQDVATDHTLRFHDDATSLVKDLTARARQPKPSVKLPRNRAGGSQPAAGKKRSPAASSQQPAGGRQRAKGSGSGGSGTHTK